MKDGLTSVKQERAYYLDWLRVLGMITVFYFHCSRIFDPLDFHVKNNETSMIPFLFVSFCMFWLMPLFFLVAGASSRFAYGTKPAGKYLRDRSIRLLIPFVMGVVLLVPPQDYVEQVGKQLFHGSFLAYLPRQINILAATKISPDYFGNIGHHVWFLAFLFIFSVMAIPVFKFLRQDAGKRLIGKLADGAAQKGAVYLLVIPLAVIYMFLKPLSSEYLGWADFIYWFIIFVYGFVLMSDPRWLEIVRHNRILALIVGIVSFGIIITLMAVGLGLNWYMHPDYSPGSLGFYLLWVIVTWSWLLFWLGTARQYLNYQNKFLQYANEAALPFYLLHQTVILLIAFYVVHFPMSIFLKFLTICTASLIATLGLYELIVKPINLLRFLFGMKPKAKIYEQRNDRHSGCLDMARNSE